MRIRRKFNVHNLYGGEYWPQMRAVNVPMTEIQVGDVLCEGTEEKTYSVVVSAGGDPDGFQFSTVNVDGSEGPCMRTPLGTTPVMMLVIGRSIEPNAEALKSFISTLQISS
jgi:hypothetical protein